MTVRRVAEVVKEHHLNVVIGLVVVKSIDTAKAIADDSNCPVAILQRLLQRTLTSALSVILLSRRRV